MFNNIYVLQNDSFINNPYIESNTSSTVYSENEKNLKHLIKKTYFYTDLFRILALTLPLKLEYDWISLSNSKPDYNEFI